MNKRQLGNANLMVSPIGLGCWQFSKARGIAGMYWGSIDQTRINDIVAISISEGVNWFDTAEAYGSGTSEQALATALQHHKINPGDVIIATKWQPVFRFANSIHKTIENRIQSLSPYPVDIYQVHNPFSFSSVEKQMQAMAKLVQEKKISYIGVSNFSAMQMRTAHKVLFKEGVSLISNQVRFHLLDRSIEKNGILETAKELGITIIAYSPLAQGILSGRYHANPNLIKTKPGFRKFIPAFRKNELERTRPLIDELQKIAEKHDVTSAQIALAWVISVHGESIVAIPGASSAQQAKANAIAMNIKISEEDSHNLDTISSNMNKGQ